MARLKFNGSIIKPSQNKMHIQSRDIVSFDYFLSHLTLPVGPTPVYQSFSRSTSKHAQVMVFANAPKTILLVHGDPSCQTQGSMCPNDCRDRTYEIKNFIWAYINCIFVPVIIFERLTGLILVWRSKMCLRRQLYW